MEGSESDLLDLQANFFDRRGAFWVLVATQDDGTEKVVGCNAILADASIADAKDAKVCHLKRLYLAPEHRGSTYGHQLMQVVIEWAQQARFQRLELWSDTRFHRAHRFFEKSGLAKSGTTRTMNDSHEPYSEYLFYLDLQT